MYNLYNSGYTSLNEFCKKNFLLQNMVYPLLKRGISLNSKYIEEHPILLNFIEKDIDISNFKIKYYDNHIELFGEEKKLKEFAKKK